MGAPFPIPASWYTSSTRGWPPVSSRRRPALRRRSQLRGTSSASSLYDLSAGAGRAERQRRLARVSPSSSGGSGSSEAAAARSMAARVGPDREQRLRSAPPSGARSSPGPELRPLGGHRLRRRLDRRFPCSRSCVLQTGSADLASDHAVNRGRGGQPSICIRYPVAIVLPSGMRAQWVGASLSASRPKEILGRAWRFVGGG